MAYRDGDTFLDDLEDQSHLLVLKSFTSSFRSRAPSMGSIAPAGIEIVHTGLTEVYIYEDQSHLLVLKYEMDQQYADLLTMDQSHLLVLKWDGRSRGAWTARMDQSHLLVLKLVRVFGMPKRAEDQSHLLVLK